MRCTSRVTQGLRESGSLITLCCGCKALLQLQYQVVVFGLYVGFESLGLWGLGFRGLGVYGVQV